MFMAAAVEHGWVDDYVIDYKLESAKDMINDGLSAVDVAKWLRLPLEKVNSCCN